MCPVTKTEFNGLQPFVCIWTTGFILSMKAIKEMGLKFLQDEYGPFSEVDIVALIPLDNELPEQIQQMKNRRTNSKINKKKRNLQIEKEQQKKRKNIDTHDSQQTGDFYIKLS